MARKTENKLIEEWSWGEVLNDSSYANINVPMESIDWKYLVATVCREGLAGVIFHYLQRHNLADKMPQDEYHYLASCYDGNTKRNVMMLSQAKWLFNKLAEKGIKFIVLKGLCLVEQDYPSLGMRGMSDIDILVRKDDLLYVDRILSPLGYTSRDGTANEAIKNPPGYLASLDYRRHGLPSLSLHIHWHLVNTSTPATMFAEHVDMLRIWEKATPARIADVETLTLSPEHMIIYLCEHAMRVGHSFDRLILVYDIFQFIRSRSSVVKSCNTRHLTTPSSYEHGMIDWNLVVKESYNFNIAPLVYCGLSVVSHYTSMPIPSEVMTALKSPASALGEKLFLFLQLKNRRIRGSSYLVYLTMNKSFFEKCKFLLRTFFPPPQVLAQKQYLRGADAKPSYLFRARDVLVQLFRIILGFFSKNTPL